MTNDNHSAILLMGASIIDIIVRPASPDVFETGSSPAEAIMMSVGADALNEATILAKMGKQVYLETVIGDDEAGRYIINHCKKNGIRISVEAVREEYATGINVVLVQENGERNFLTNKNGTLRKLRLEDIRMPFPECVKIVCFASIFVFPYIGVEELRIIFSQAKAQGKIVCADMTKCKNGETVEDMAAALSYVDYLFPNCEEALLLTGQKTVETAAEKLKAAGVDTVIIKAGNRGCYIRNDRYSQWIPAIGNVTCIDTTGAGDSFVAGFICALFEGMELLECVQYANECGAKSVQSVGATTWL